LPADFSPEIGQGHQAALLTAVLARQAATAVGMETCWPWETAAMLPSARGRKALLRPRRRRGEGAYRGGRLPTACLKSGQLCFAENFPVFSPVRRTFKSETVFGFA